NPAQKPRRPISMWRLVNLAALVIVAFIMIMPFVWLVSSSLKSQLQIFQYPPQWLPDPFHWDNYSRALTEKPFGIYLKNTLTICVLNVIAVVFSSSLCAYGFARIRFPGRDFWFGIVMATLFLPYAILIVPLFLMFTTLGWVDTLLP